MSGIERLVCSHDFERRAVYVDTGEAVEVCRDCGTRRRTPATTTEAS